MTGRALLLDLDGTLIDSRPGVLASIDAALRALGHAPDPAFDLGFVLGPPLEDSFPVVLGHYGDTRVDQAVAAYREHYAAVGMFECSVYPGIDALLPAVRQAGWRMFLATSKQAAFARPILENLKLDGWFDGIYGAAADGALSHKPALLAHILAQEAVAAADAVMLGDRSHDILGARANGVRAIGALWGYGSRAELTEAGADALAASPAEVVGLLL